MDILEGVAMPVPILILTAAMALAEADYHVKSGEPMPDSATPAASAWVIRASDCRTLHRYRPKAGVEHRGKADMTAYPDFGERARNLAIAIKVQVDDQLPPLGPTGKSVGGEGFLTFIEVKDGELYVDGKPLGADGVAAVKDACRRDQDNSKGSPQDR